MSRRVLIVDDDASMLRLLEKYLTADGYEVLTADNGEEALRLMTSKSPRIVITDWMMPGMDGLELCRAIRSSEDARWSFILVLTAHSEKGRLLEAFKAGADDFLSKPFHREELRARVNVGVRVTSMQEDLAEHNRSLCKANAELAVLNRKLEQMATTDALTGLANRRIAMTQLAEHWAITERHEHPLACILLDIDHFKDINDSHGHEAGDVVLRESAQLLKRLTRAGEMPYRLGGEEFLILCPGDSAEVAAGCAERLRRAVESNRIRYNDRDLSITVSAGVVQRDEMASTPEDLLRYADNAMYAAKRAGRNQVCVAGKGHPVVFPGFHGKQAHASHSCSPPAARVAESAATVMIVDDDSSTRELCRHFLEQAGYRVSEALDARHALAKIASETPDVIIMDAVMPDMDGLACVRQLRTNPATRDIPIIMASAQIRQEDITEGHNAGVNEYIAKPIGREDCLRRVRALSRLRHRDLDPHGPEASPSEHARS